MFTGQTTLRTINFPDGLHHLPNLRGCTNLESISVPESLEYDGYLSNDYLDKRTLPNLNRFYGRNISSDGLFIIVNGKLKAAVTVLPEEITIPSNVDIIDAYAFSLIHSVKIIRMNDRISEIGPQAFRDMSVQAYYFSSLVPPTLSADAFYDGFDEGGKIYVPFAAVDDYKTAGPNWTSVVDRIVGY